MPEGPPNECREQFSKSGRTPSDRSSQSFSSKLEKILKVNIFFRKHTFLEKFSCSSKMHFWQLLLGFCANVAECSSHSRKTAKKLKKFIEKTVHSTISFGHTKCSFDEPAESSYRTPKTFSLKFRRKKWIFSQEKNNLTHKFFSYSTFFDKNLEFFWSLLKKNVKIFPSKIKFSKNFFCTHKLQFWQTFWIFCAKMPECFPRSPRTVKILINFCRKNSPIKNLHWTYRMQFWQTYRKILAKSPKKLFPNSKNLETIRRNCFQKTTYPKKSPGHLKAVSATQQDYYRQKSKMLSSKSENNWKFWKVCEKEKCFFKNVLWTRRKQFWPTCQKFFTKFQNFSLKIR